MTRLLFTVTLNLVIGCGWAIAESLPVWSKIDRARLLSGELIAGADILYEDSALIPLPQVTPEPELPYVENIEPEPEYDPEVIPAKFLPVYFDSNPEGYLIDPQRLLSMQETLDREGFLIYHANDSELDIKMYLFDERQKIPDFHSIQKICQQRYAGGPLTAVVFSFLGDPSRNQIAFGGDGAAEVSESEVRNILRSSMIKAMEKSDPSAQLEAFIVQLSIHLYWLERERIEVQAIAALEEARDEAERNPDTLAAADVSAADTNGSEKGISMMRTYAPYIIGGSVGLLSLCCGLCLGWSLWRGSRRYHFPVFESPERLGASYAAGVGAVLAFHSELSSPSSQRHQVSNYLTRM